MNKILFLLKRRENFRPREQSKNGMITGLFNSASYAKDMLSELNIDSNMNMVFDDRQIESIVNEYKPSHVIIEALWVAPYRLNELTNLYPTINWIIRLHSDLPFLSAEGNALQWINECIKYNNVYVAPNSNRLYHELTMLIHDPQKLIYLPNYYPTNFKTKEYKFDSDVINVGCFGSVRPLKNHLVQAFAALKFANSINKKLHFHINARSEEGDAAITNLKNMFSHLKSKGHELINHEWSLRDEFLELCSTMDMGLQVSFSETFNIVGADLLSVGVPVVGSAELPYLCKSAIANPTDSNDIYSAMLLAYNNPLNNVVSSQQKLTEYSNRTKEIWNDYFINGIQNRGAQNGTN